jgi:hypothetical protein
MTAPLITRLEEAAEGSRDKLVARLISGERSNALDVLIEVALFVPDETTFDATPNAAGTKVIYANRDGSFSTHWAPVWSLKPEAAIDALRATNQEQPNV